MNATAIVNRRNFLVGLGALISLPQFESLANPSKDRKTNAVQRVAFIYVPNGINMIDWTPQGPDIPFILSPLNNIRSKVNIITNLEHKLANPNGDGAGDHARASATFLTGMQAKKTSGADIRIGKSIDQIFADKWANQTRLNSLELSCDTVRSSGDCDSGYSCAYQFNLAWKNDNTPLSPEVNPRLAFERMFGAGANSSAEDKVIAKYRKDRKLSVLDFVKDEAESFRKKLGKIDQSKLDQYLYAVRETERKLENEERFVTQNIENKFTEARDFQTHLEMMYDLMYLAFQNDTTRVISFIVSHDGSNRPYSQIGVNDGHHDMSHHQNDKAKKDNLSKINNYHMQFFSKFLNKLEAAKEGENTLLDNCSIVYGAGISDGNKHNHNDLPILLAGRGGKTFNSGKHIIAPKTPMCNMYLGLLDKHGIEMSSFGDSTGKYNIT